MNSEQLNDTNRISATCSSSLETAKEYTMSSSASKQFIDLHRKNPRIYSPTEVKGILVALFIAGLMTLPATMAQNTAKCYFFGPGITIPGADYRRDYGLTQSQCARVCKSDVCCMAFEWHKEKLMCTLKSRSLNGTVTVSGADVYFGLCIDYADSERDRLWDHEIGGRVTDSVQSVHRDKCADACKDAMAGKDVVSKKNSLFSLRARRNEKKETDSVVIYNWHSDDPTDMDTQTGRCDCISILHSVKLSFGSFSGFQI